MPTIITLNAFSPERLGDIRNVSDEIDLPDTFLEVGNLCRFNLSEQF